MIILVFWYQQRLVGDVPVYLKFALKVTQPPLKNADFDQYMYIMTEPRASENCLIIVNRKSTTNFSTSYR